MNLTKILAAVAAFAALACNVAQATPVNLVTNGGFETTTNGAGQLGYNTTAAGWSTTGYNFVFAPNTADSTGAVGSYGSTYLWGPGKGANNGFTNSPTGGNFLAADGAYEVGAITQTISGLVIGQTYTLTFDWAAAQQYGYSGATTEQWTASLGGQKFSTAVYSDANHGFSGWMSQSFTYTATSTTEVLAFLAAGTPNGEPPFSLLDNVSLTANVPEPSTVALFVGGLALLGGAMRLRRRPGSGKAA
jgi:hypothetical protein